MGQTEWGNRAPDMAQDKIDHWRLGPAQLIASASDDDGFDRRAANRLLERAGEVLQDDNRLRARIGELVAKFARRVQWVAVDDHIARAQRAERGDRILQQVRHHQRHAGALGQARDILEVVRESAGLQIQFAIGNRLAHTDEGDPAAKLVEAFGNEIAKRAERA